MDSTKPPLVLVHGLAMSGNAWREVVPLVSGHHEVFAPTADGHRGGEAAQRRPATMTDMVDAAERYLGECGLDRPHLAGNSMGVRGDRSCPTRSCRKRVSLFSGWFLDGR